MVIRTHFHTKIVTLVKCNFRTYYNVGSGTLLIEWLMFTNNPELQWLLLEICCENIKWVFLKNMPCYYFSLEAVFQGVAKNNPTKKELDAEFEATMKHNYLHPNVRSSHAELFCEKGVLKNLSKFTGKHLCQNLFFNKVADLRQLY